MIKDPIVLVLIHNNSREAEKVAAQVCQELLNRKVKVCAPKDDLKLIASHNVKIEEYINQKESNPNLALVFGGDGTILRAVELLEMKIFRS